MEANKITDSVLHEVFPEYADLATKANMVIMEEERSDSFGDVCVHLAGPTLDVRLIRDRGEKVTEVRDKLGGDWHWLVPMLEYLGIENAHVQRDGFREVRPGALIDNLEKIAEILCDSSKMTIYVTYQNDWRRKNASPSLSKFT